MNILYFLPSKQTFFLLPYSVTFYKHSSRFPPSLCDNRTRLQAPAQLWKEVTANKLTLCFIGLTSQQTLSRHAALAVSLTPVCLNIKQPPRPSPSLSYYCRCMAKGGGGQESTFTQRLQRIWLWTIDCTWLTEAGLSNQRAWILIFIICLATQST